MHRRLLRAVREVIEHAFPDSDVDEEASEHLLTEIEASRHAELLPLANRLRDLDEAVEDRVAAFRRLVRRELDRVSDAGQAVAGLVRGVPEASVFPTYTCRATHRRSGPVACEFETAVQMVRVPLGEDDTPDYATALGFVFSSDHLLYAVRQVREQYGALLGSEVARVDLITAPRIDTLRFAPVSLFLGYADRDDDRPFFFVIEAGTALGQPKVLYLGRTMDAQLSYPTGYRPTPFASPDFRYRSTLSMAEPGEPDTLVIEAARSLAHEPHLCITARFRREAIADVVFPGENTAVAAMRISAIAEAWGRDETFVEAALARLGSDSLPWVQAPVSRRKAPGAPPEQPGSKRGASAGDARARRR